MLGSFAPKIREATDGIRTHGLILTKDALYQLSYMGAYKSIVIISPNPNTQNDKKPISSIFYRKSEELPASVILLHSSDESKNSGLAISCQQII